MSCRWRPMHSQYSGSCLASQTNYVFTTTDGAKPVNGFSKIKERLDKLSGVEDWVLHGLRRTMRNHLSALSIEDRVREQMIAHAQPGLHKVYELYDYLPEKRKGFEPREARLRGILAPKPPADVADLEAERARRVA
jgi:integrase